MSLNLRQGLRSLVRSSTPSAPASGTYALYPKTTGWFGQSSAGVEDKLTVASELNAAYAINSTAKPAIVDYFDKVNLTVDWATTTAGGAVPATNAAVSSNRLQATTTTNPGGAIIPFQVLPGETAHIKGILFWKVAAAATPIYFGIDTGTYGHSPVASTPDGIHLGITGAAARTDAMGANHTAALSARVAPIAVGSNPSGSDTNYSWSIDIDLDTVSFHLRKIGVDSDLYSFSVARAVLANAGKVINGISLYLTATAGAATHQFGPVVASRSLQPSRTATVASMAIETAEHSHFLRPRSFNSTERWRLDRPKTYVPTDGADLCLFMHWAITADDITPWSDSRMQAMRKAISDSGMFFASASDGGVAGDRYGAPVSLTNYLALYQYVRDNYNIKKLFVLAPSGGAFPALNLLTHDGFPTPAAMALISPGTDLAAVYAASPTYAALIRPAYGMDATGTDYATKSAGYDPALRAGSDFRPVPTIWFTSASDTVVPTATHVTPMVAKLSPYSTQTVVTRTGIHLDADQFQPSDVTTFFNTYR